jgi:mannose-6-phosphate isomerase
VKLRRQQVEKPWGRTSIPSAFGETNGRKIGEIWFEAPPGADLPLLVKYIFTSEKLSVQVHPDDAQAKARGLARGKSECWYILEAEPGATLGLGLREPVSADELSDAAVNGSLEELMDWKAVKAGDFFYVPAGTIHAIGAGITLLELQQNSDVTYRLYDYGRPRELHLDDALAVSNRVSYPQNLSSQFGENVDAILVDGPLFNVIRSSQTGKMLSAVSDRRRWVMPLKGCVRAHGDIASAAECILVDAGVDLDLSDDAMLLCGSEGALRTRQVRA